MSIYTGINGTRVIGAYAPLGTPNWAVVTELPWQEAYQPVFQVIAVSIGIILLMAVLAGLAGVLIARRLAVPLVDLTKTASRIAGGEMQLQATPTGSQEIASLATAFNSMTAQLRELISSLEQRVADRTKEVERQVLRVRIAAEIARDISSAPNLDELLTRTGELIVNRFNFYHTGIFLLDDKKEYAVLYASPTEAGKQLIANNHRLRVGEQGIVGRVAASGEARIALDTGADAVYFNNPLLPTTRSEMALPLKTRNEILGVLDIQSNQPRAFVQEDIEILQVLADQLAIAIERINLLKRVEDQLKEIEQAYQEFTQQSWQGLARNQTQITGYRFRRHTITAYYSSARKFSESCSNRHREYAANTIRQFGISSHSNPFARPGNWYCEFTFAQRHSFKRDYCYRRANCRPPGFCAGKRPAHGRYSPQSSTRTCHWGSHGENQPIH